MVVISFIVLILTPMPRQLLLDILVQNGASMLNTNAATSGDLQGVATILSESEPSVEIGIHATSIINDSSAKTLVSDLQLLLVEREIT